VRNTKIQELSDGRVIVIIHEPMEGGGWVATHEDVTRLRRIEAKLSHMARHDALTDLPNRVLLRERIERCLADECAQGRCLVVLQLEIDRWDVNDTFGLDRRRAAAGRGAAGAGVSKVWRWWVASAATSSSWRSSSRSQQPLPTRSSNVCKPCLAPPSISMTTR
jgi:hypothetical protein